MGPNLRKIENQYDAVAKEYAEAFSGEHEKKPKDQEILHRFSEEIGDRRPLWDFGCGPGQTSQYLKNLGIEISGLDLSEKILEQARTIHPEIHFRKGNILELEFENDSIAGAASLHSKYPRSNRQPPFGCTVTHCQYHIRIDIPIKEGRVHPIACLWKTTYNSY